jgi:hypothetical protein
MITNVFAGKVTSRAVDACTSLDASSVNVQFYRSGQDGEVNGERCTNLDIPNLVLESY